MEDNYEDQEIDIEQEVEETEDELVDRLAASMDNEVVEDTKEPEPIKEPPVDPPTQNLYKVKVDGVEREVTLDELRNGYQRQSDYTSKTQQLSQERQQVEAEAQKYNQYVQSIPMLAQVAQQNVNNAIEQLNSAELVQLATTNTAEYVAIKAQLEATIYENTQAYNQMGEAWTEQQATAQQIQQQALQEVLVRSTDILNNSIEGWKDGSVRPKLKEAALKYGFSKQEAENIWDHRQVEVLNKARLYDEMMSKTNLTSKRVESLPPKTLKPGGGEIQQDDKTAFKKQAMKKAAAGNEDDLIAFLSGGV